MFDSIDPSWPQDVQDRLNELNCDASALHERSSAIIRALPPQVRQQLLRQAVGSNTNQKRLFWLRREADQLNQAAATVSACGQQCSHCCHSGVMLLDSEAKAIGREIGRVPADLPEGKYVVTNLDNVGDDFLEKADELASEFTGDPCPFLGPDSKCSIYAHRPLACRTQINMDKDALLCKLVPGGKVPVPYLDVTASKMAYVVTFGLNRKMADLRYFFPKP